MACPDSRAIGIAHYLPRKQNNQKASVACFVLTRQVMTIMYGTSGRELWVGTLFYLFLGTFIKYVQNYFREVDLQHKIFLISIFVCTKDFFITCNKWLHFPICTSKVWTFWEGHKIWKNLPLKIWRYWVMSNFKWKIFFKFCGLLRISEL